MKKNLLSSVITLVSIALFSCGHNDAFTITGTLENPGSLKKVFLMEADSTDIKMVDSANLSEQGKFEFKHTAPYANLYRLRVGGTMFDLIAKNGDDIDFKTNLTDHAHTYSLTGSEESEKYREFNKINNFYAEKTGKITQEYQDKAQAIGHESDSLVSIYYPMFQKNIAAYSEEVLKFVNANKHSLAGFYAALSLDPGKYEQQLIAYADDIKGDFKDNPGVQTFIKRMMTIKPVSIGHAAPDFTIGGIDGAPIKLSDYKGKYVMLDFWASWCAPCRKENPNVVKQYTVYNPLGLNILGISLDENKGKWKQAIDADKLTWAHGSDLKNFEGPTEVLYHVDQIPTNFIIDPKGIIVAKNVTGTDLEEFLNKTFSKSQQIVKIK